MNRSFDVYGIGNALVDLVLEVDHDFITKHKIDKGLMTLVDDERQAELLDGVEVKPHMMKSGGSAANTIISVSQFGGNGFYAFKVANDAYGHFYIEDLQRAGVKTKLNKENAPTGVTGRCLVLVTPDADRTMNTFLGITSALTAEELDFDALKDSHYSYIEGYLVSSPEGRQTMMESKLASEQSGVKTALTFSDINMINFFREGMENVIGKGLDLVFGNEEEVKAYTKTNNLMDAKEAMKNVARTFVITRGKDGALIYDGKNFIDIEPHEVNAVDSNGAGDMFAGGFLYGITSGHTFEEAGHIASLASSKVVSKFGPRLDNHEPKEVLEHLRKNKKIDPNKNIKVKVE
jgi:sugar/nucleoside kinase (ribokinase family)